MKVKATNQYKKLNVEDKELKRIPKEGEVFEVTEERFKVLSGDNKYKAVFIKAVKETTSPTKADTTQRKAKSTK